MPTPKNPFATPTTKAKQRTFVEALINGIHNNRIKRTQILTLLADLHQQLNNRVPVKRAPASADSVTVQKQRAVLSMRRKHPDMTNQDIANRLNLNSGRVSEILAGKRV